MEMTLRLPSSYVDIERDEMEYVDGGIFGFQPSYFAQSYNNVISRMGARAFSLAGGWMVAGACYSYWSTATKFGGIAAKLVGMAASVVTGPAGWALGFAAGLSVGGLVIYMGNGVRFS